MAGRSALKVWSGIAARRLGERSLLPDFGSRVYTLLIGMCVVRAVASTLISLYISPNAQNKAHLAVLQFGIFGAAFACLAGLQAARYAARIDGFGLLSDTPLFHPFRRLIGRRFLFERPFAVGGGLILAALGWVVLLVEPKAYTGIAVLAAILATAALAFAVYRFIPPTFIRKHGFNCELALGAAAVMANPDIMRVRKTLATTIFNVAISPEALSDRISFLFSVYAATVLGLILLAALIASPDLLAGALNKWRGYSSVPVWAMPLKQVRGSYWALVWGLIYLVYAFFGRNQAAMIVPSVMLAIVAGVGRLLAFIAASAQALGEDGNSRFPVRYGIVAAILIALPHCLPCVILAFVK